MMDMECISCTYFARPADAPESVPLQCMWQPSEEGEYEFPCGIVQLPFEMEEDE